MAALAPDLNLAGAGSPSKNLRQRRQWQSSRLQTQQDQAQPEADLSPPRKCDMLDSKLSIPFSSL